MTTQRAFLTACQSCAPGLDTIMYDTIKHLHAGTELMLLAHFKNIYLAGYFLSPPKKAIFILVLKHSKNPH